ncbi:uncharacterized protein LOC129905699 [Episyrphus balteatus]|uniref:uncharacterized protein LOC129905699 n=1 Tax=Episyrphus balteatus TaxID=286459 RepID=UPI0024850F63|nr:uncharacterized protein LOC129905699 [Episyrphus balteatus]
MTDFERIQNEIEAMLDDEADLASETDYRVEFEDSYYNNAAILSDIIESQGVSNPFGGGASDELNKSLQILTDNQSALTEMLKTVSEQSRRSINITKVDSNTRLPQTKLPEFHGGYDEWMRFHDLFVAMVQSKENISGAEKMDYLLSCLKGNTSSVIKHLSPSNANFDVAWDLLKSLFDKPQFITVAHFDNLFEFPTLKGTGLDEIKCFFRIISENINALRALKKPVESWNTLLVLCSQKHNTMLHQGQVGPDVSLPGCSRNIACGMSVHSVNHALRECYTLLPTAIVSVVDVRGQLHKCRALLDSGSQATLISEDCVQRLNLKRSHARIPIHGIGQNGSSLGTRGVVSLSLHSSGESKFMISTNAYILSKLTGDLPTLPIPKSKLAFFENLQLADPQCFIPSKIDILLGSDVFFDILSDGKIVHPSGSPTAQNTAFGWILAGNISSDSQQQFKIFTTAIDRDYLFQRFLGFEDFPEIHSSQSDVHEQIENHFVSTHCVRPDGRYVIRLPFKTSTVEFGNSRNAALRVLHSMERRFINNPDLKQEYIRFMREYELLGHMAPVSPSESHQPSFYMPHHAVLKPSSTTTKLRVVFNASCKSSNGISLNDCLMVGPVIQNDLVTSLIGFRKFPVAVKADIAKMYRQILVNDDDNNYQRIVWREDVNQEPIDYRLLTLTYGTAPASFIATRVLKQIGIDGSTKYPQASNSLKFHFYVDDYNEGFYSVEDAVQTKNDLCKILRESGMELRKWASNSSTFLSTFEAESLEISSDLPMGDSSVKLLGLVWDTEADIFKFSLQLPSLRSQISKREVLSDIARIFDPLGLLSPTIIKMKLFMQKLWLKGVSWDSIIPSELYDEWADIRADLKNIALIRIARWIQHEKGELIELHGFADASESAYAAAVYCRVKRSDGRVSTSLVCAKTRVAPVRKKLTIPKLELCGALLLTKLLSKTKESLNSHNIECFAYTDASTVLHWIQGYPRPRNVFADNRLAQITAQLPSSVWHYVRSAENPADCGTRGIMPKHLPSLDLWWEGPLFLQKSDVIFTQLPSSNLAVEETEISCFAISAEPEWDIFQWSSSLNRLLRVVARCIRLIRKYRRPRIPLNNWWLSPSDIHSAKIAVLRLSQRTSFSDEIDCLLRNKPVAAKSKIFRMNPFIDECGVLRVGGRLSNAEVPFNQKYPVILHKRHRLTDLIVLDCHMRNLHAGIRQMTYLLSLEHFIVDVHHAVKRCIYKCPNCMRQRAIPFKQQMGDLPRQRLEPGLAFNNAGVDYAGPFIVSSWKGRGAKRFKTYIALFVCLATKALHLEAVTDLTSEAFIAALRRFVARRGRVPDQPIDDGVKTLKRWQYVQRLVQQFWKRWSSDYISQLQKRNKWAEKLKDIEINDIVIIKDDNQPPCHWLVGRVTQVYPGTDGLVRVVSVRTSKGEAKRPISKLCPLFIDI